MRPRTISDNQPLFDYPAIALVPRLAMAFPTPGLLQTHRLGLCPYAGSATSAYLIALGLVLDRTRRLRPGAGGRLERTVLVGHILPAPMD
jgi:hypothetical protein